MRYFIIVIIAIFFLVPTNESDAQNKTLKQLSIGDTVPNINITSLINYKTKTAKISDFRGKLLILDYWSIWCGGCIDALPQLEKLQNEFKDKIAILPVAFTRPQKDVEAFLNKMARNNRKINLPSAVYPTMRNDLMTLFPAVGFPMEVWIDSQGKLIAITDSYFVTRENIQKVIKHELIDFPISSTYIKSDIVAKTLSGYRIAKEDTCFYSRITGFNDTISQLAVNFFKQKKGKRFTHYSIFNTSIVYLFKASMYKGRTVRNDHLVSLEITDSAHYFYPQSDTGFYNNQKRYTYCYELNVPSSVSIDEAMSVMNKELGAYFQVSSSIEKCWDTCYVLKQIEPSFNLKTSHKVTNTFYDRSIGFAKLENVPIKNLTDFLYSERTPIIIDETGYKTNIDIAIQFPENRKFEDVNVELSKNNLCLKKEYRLVEKMVLKKKPPL